VQVAAACPASQADTANEPVGQLTAKTGPPAGRAQAGLDVVQCGRGYFPSGRCAPRMRAPSLTACKSCGFGRRSSDGSQGRPQAPPPPGQLWQEPWRRPIPPLRPGAGGAGPVWPCPCSPISCSDRTGTGRWLRRSGDPKSPRGAHRGRVNYGTGFLNPAAERWRWAIGLRRWVPGAFQHADGVVGEKRGCPGRCHRPWNHLDHRCTELHELGAGIGGEPLLGKRKGAR